MYGKLLAYLRDHRTRQDFYNFSEDSAALTSRDLTVFGYCVARGMEYLASKKVSFPFVYLNFSFIISMEKFGRNRTISIWKKKLREYLLA